MKDESLTNVLAVIIVLVLLFGIVSIVDEVTNPKCEEYGCDNNRKEGSSYCYLHTPYTYKSTSSYKAGYSSKTTGAGKTAGSSGTNGKSTYSYSSKSSSNKTSSHYGSYDDGYDDIYENDDVDWDRYSVDDDYANGVDDAMDDIGW